MKLTGIILSVLLCLFTMSGCSDKESDAITADSKTNSTQMSTQEETSGKNEMTIILKDNETGDLLEDKVVDEEEKITSFNELCSRLKSPSDEKYAKAFFDSITSNEYTLYFSSSDFTEEVLERDNVTIVECNNLYYELAAGGEEWQMISDYLKTIVQ